MSHRKSAIPAPVSLEFGKRNGSALSGDQIYVVDAGTGEAHRIASGKTAVWSWN